MRADKGIVQIQLYNTYGLAVDFSEPGPIMSCLRAQRHTAFLNVEVGLPRVFFEAADWERILQSMWTARFRVVEVVRIRDNVMLFYDSTAWQESDLNMCSSGIYLISGLSLQRLQKLSAVFSSALMESKAPDNEQALACAPCQSH